MPTVDDSIKVMVSFLEQTVQQHPNQPINIHNHFVEMAFDVIARVAMGQQGTRQFANSDAQLAVQTIQRINNNLFDYYAWIFPWFGQNVLHSVLSWTARLRNDPIGNEYEKKMNHRHKDFVDIFLDSEAENVNEVPNPNNGKFDIANEQIERKVCTEEVAMQCFLFVLAGFDTTASSLSQVCHWLAWNPAVHDRVQSEIDSIFDANDEEDMAPSYEQLSKLKYTEAVIKEALRLSPRVITRECCKETTVGTHAEYRLEKGDGLQVDVMSLHRDKRIWGEDAEYFVPERWISLNNAQTAFHAYYGFGAGPRMRLGMRMAIMENKMALVRLICKFNIRRCAETELKIEFTGRVVLTPRSVHVMLIKR